jgi:hypothetical protein
MAETAAMVEKRILMFVLVFSEEKVEDGFVV